jgi:hypothetical protein
MNAPFKHRRKFLFFPLIAAAFIFAGGFAVMYLWNAILPEVITSVGKLTYIQAIGILILCRILFGAFKGGRGHGGYCGHSSGRGYGWREKMQGMSEEEREKFKAEWRERCGRK